MILITKYRVKPFLSRDGTKQLLELLAKEGTGPGVIAHYIAADSSHGVVISETDDVAAVYRSSQIYYPWIEQETHVMLKIEEAVPLIMETLA